MTDKKISPATDADEKNTDQKTYSQDSTGGEIIQGAIVNNAPMNDTPKQILENLPTDILNLSRFVKTGNKGNPKAPYEGWSKPENQKFYHELEKPVGFIAATENDDSLIFYDFDHVLDDNGNFVNANAEKWFNYLHDDDYFCERSISGKGLHMFGIPTKGKFPKGRHELDLGDGAKIEIFYGTNKNCCVTGDCFHCEPKAPVAHGQAADDVFETLLDEVALQNKKPQKSTQQKPTAPPVYQSTNSPDFDIYRAEKMLEVIRVADLSREDWLNVGMALKNNGNTCADWEQWSRADERFKVGECDRLWQGFNGAGLTIATIHDLAKQYGYSEKDIQREWYQLHPDKKPSVKRTMEEQPAQITNTTENFNGEIYMTGLLEDLDNGRRLAKFCSDRVKWLTDSERWIIWENKGVWLRCSEKNSCLAPEVSRFADLMMRHAIQLIKEAEKFSQAYLEISTEKDGRVKTNATPEAKDAEKKMKKANEKKEKALAIAHDFRKVKKVSCAITMMKGVEDILITAEDLDNHPNLINCLNYVVDLQDKKLYPHTETRLKLITQQCRAAYIPNAQSELVDSFFKAIQPDEMTCAGLLRWLGYCLTGEVSEEKFMVHTGDGGNGKGVLSATVLELLASYGVGLAPTALLKSNKPIDADKASTALNGIELARFAISEEMPADGELDTSLIKNLTGGDRINLRKLYSEYRTVKPTAKINISGNYTPKIENVHDGGLLRRMLNMPYLVKFGTPNNPADHNLKKKLILPENLNALLRLLVDEAFDWYRDGLIISPQMAQETKRHLAQNDFIADFIDDNETYERGANFTVKAKEFIDALKREYPRECSRFKRNDLIKLIAETDGITYTTDRTRARVFRGIGKKGAPQQQSFDDFDGEPISPDDLQP